MVVTNWMKMVKKIYDTTSPYLGNRNIAYEMLFNKEESIRNVLGGQAFCHDYITVRIVCHSKRRLKQQYK